MQYVWATLIAIGVFIGTYLLTPWAVQTLAGITIEVPGLRPINVLGVIVGVILAVIAFRWSVILIRRRRSTRQPA